MPPSPYASKTIPTTVEIFAETLPYNFLERVSKEIEVSKFSDELPYMEGILSFSKKRKTTHTQKTCLLHLFFFFFKKVSENLIYIFLAEFISYRY